MKYMRSMWDALTGQGGRHGSCNNTLYSAVNTQDPGPYGDIYTPTTVQDNPRGQPSSRSLNPAVAVFDRFLQGRLHQKKQRSKCESTSYTHINWPINQSSNKCNWGVLFTVICDSQESHGMHKTVINPWKSFII